jgi:hypothetical protein
VNRGELRRCPECGQAYPHDADHALRRLAWLHDLPRRISASNNDVLIHDGVHGKDRFLLFELKTPHEQWPPQDGQRILLMALSRLPGVTVRILRGSVEAIDLYRVSSTGIDPNPLRTSGEAINRAATAWCNGVLWRDAEATLGTFASARVVIAPCAILSPDYTETCLEPTGHAGPHKGREWVWPQAIAS